MYKDGETWIWRVKVCRDKALSPYVHSLNEHLGQVVKPHFKIATISQVSSAAQTARAINLTLP